MPQNDDLPDRTYLRHHLHILRRDRFVLNVKQPVPLRRRSVVVIAGGRAARGGGEENAVTRFFLIAVEMARGDKFEVVAGEEPNQLVGVLHAIGF